MRCARGGKGLQPSTVSRVSLYRVKREYICDEAHTIVSRGQCSPGVLAKEKCKGHTK